MQLAQSREKSLFPLCCRVRITHWSTPLRGWRFLLSKGKLALKLVDQCCVFFECIKKIHVGLKGLLVEFILVGFIDKDDIQLKAFYDLNYCFAGKDDFVQSIDKARNRFLLDTSL